VAQHSWWCRRHTQGGPLSHTPEGTPENTDLCPPQQVTLQMDVWGEDERAVVSEQPDVPSWKLYHKGGMISSRHEQILRDFGDNMVSSRGDRDTSFRHQGVLIAEAFLAGLKSINIPESLWYLLYALDEVLTEDEGRAIYFHRAMLENARAIEQAAATAATKEDREEISRDRFEYYKPLLRLIPGTENEDDIPSLHMRWRVLSVLRVLLSTSSEFQGEAKVRVLEQQQQQCIREVLQSMARDARELPDDLMREEAESDGSTGGARRLILVMRVRALQASLELFQQITSRLPHAARCLILRVLRALWAIPAGTNWASLLAKPGRPRQSEPADA
jgi:hypothetical protein